MMFIELLCRWIEENLEKKLTAVDIAVKAGYSKWYLQRFFSDSTCIPLASYVRQRKLRRAAVLLKMTGMPVLAISEHVGFATQQTFTRTFTQHFGIAPGRYRIEAQWRFMKHFTALYSLCDYPPEPVLVRMTMTCSVKSHFSYYCPGPEIDNLDLHYRKRRKLGEQALLLAQSHSDYAILYSYEPVKDSCSTCLSLSLSTDFKLSDTHQGGNSYLRFIFKGTHVELIRLQAEIYLHILPARQEFRRPGSDLFIASPAPKDAIDKNHITGCYYIPVAEEKILPDPAV